MTATLRPATPPDAPAIAEIFIAAWRDGYRGVVPDDVLDGLNAAALAHTFALRIAGTALETVVAVDGRPVGFASYGGGSLVSLYVHPAAGRAGLGTRLLHHALDAMPGPEVRLAVFEGNTAARRLYEREGFRPDGSRTTDPRWRTPEIGYRLVVAS